MVKPTWLSPCVVGHCFMVFMPAREISAVILSVYFHNSPMPSISIFIFARDGKFCFILWHTTLLYECFMVCEFVFVGTFTTASIFATNYPSDFLTPALRVCEYVKTYFGRTIRSFTTFTFE